MDPSGELFGIDDLFLLTIAVNAYTSAVTSAFNASMQGRNVFEGALRCLGSSLISSIGSIGVGAYFGHGGSTLLNELLRAGAHGIVGGTASLISGEGFAPGFISGSLSSLGTSAVQAMGANSIVGAGVSMGIGALSANLSGGNWMMGAAEGLNSALLNHYGGNGNGGNWLPEVVVYGHQGYLSAVHAVLDIAGMIPCIGEFADGANAVMYTIQGDFSNAGISAAAMIPVFGNFATGGKLAAKSIEIANKLGIKNGKIVTSSDALDLAEQFLGRGYTEPIKNSGRYISKDGFRVFRMGANDLLGKHGGGPHVNFEILAPNSKGKVSVIYNRHVFLTK